jgi:hypothetical protein
LGARIFLLAEDYESDFSLRNNRSLWVDYFLLTYDVSISGDFLRGTYPFQNCIRPGGLLFGPDVFLEGSVGVAADFPGAVYTQSVAFPRKAFRVFRIA